MDAFANFFVGTTNGSIPDDYYYTLDPRGRKVYHSRRSGKRIYMKNIPVQILSKIEERSSGVNKAILIKQRASLIEQVEKLNQKIKEIDDKLERQESSVDYEAEMRKEEVKQKAAKEREKEELRQFFDNICGQQKGSKKRKPTTGDSQSSEEFLKSLGITSRKEWKQWLLKNHPDKGGKDELLCQKVIKHGKEIY